MYRGWNQVFSPDAVLGPSMHLCFSYTIIRTNKAKGIFGLARRENSRKKTMKSAAKGLDKSPFFC
jgi:hypothetical protein